MIVAWTGAFPASPGAEPSVGVRTNPALQKAETLWKTDEKSRPASVTAESGRCR